jgi:exopolyphosphatase/pppGpp-phosphohydrolase
LRGALEPNADSELAETLCYAATLLDVGRSVDFYSRHEHTVNVVRGADLAGFSHRAIAMIGATVRLADKSTAGLKAWAPLLDASNHASLVRLGAILDLADAIARQTSPDVAEPPRIWRHGGGLSIAAPWLDAWLLQSAATSVEQIFGVPVRLGRRVSVSD